MTAESTLADAVTGRTYEVVVAPRTDDAAGGLQFTFARLGVIRPETRARAAADGHQVPNDFPVWENLAVLTTPAVTDEQAKALALAWLTIVEHVDPRDLDCVMHLPGAHLRLGTPPDQHPAG